MKEWYKKEGKEILIELDVKQKKGLSTEEAENRLHKYGINELTKKDGPSAIKIFLEQFASPIIWILIIATILSAFLKEYVDAIVILTIVIINAVLGFLQEYRAERAIDALQKLTAPHAKVIRDGHTIEIKSRSIVPGDIMLAETGNKISADARIIEVHNSFQTQEAALTGESTPVTKHTNTIAQKSAVGDQKNMLFAGTIVTKGKATAVVTGTAMNTQFGKIATLLQETEREPTPLQKKFEQIAKLMSYIAIGIIGITFVLGWLRGEPALSIFLVAVALAIAAVPEGLPAVITISLGVGVQRMAKRNALIRKLPSAETLGSVSVICSDKTGTLTHNEMTVSKLWVDGDVVNVSGAGYSKSGIFSIDKKMIDPKKSSPLMLLLRIGTLCNNAIVNDRDKQTTVIGDPTEGAMLVCGEKAGINTKKLNYDNPRVGEIEFTSERKMMTTVNSTKDKHAAFVKGAVGVVLSKCTRVIIEGKVERLTKKVKDEILKTNEDFASEALRVLGCAYKGNIKKESDASEEDLTFVGLQAMIDPPRPEVKDAIAKCSDAGIKTIMITGDHITTAQAIAREIGITGAAMTGQELEKLSQTELEKRVDSIGVFARVDPEHKLKIVQALKANKHVVAMTGDGVNDAPALKKADIGIAMGQTGTDVSKEASDMILTDDHFASIVNAVEEGRGVYDNIKKFFAFLLSGNLGEVGIIILAIVIGLPLPLTAILLLMINLVTDGLPAIALGVDPFDPNIMKTKPRDLNKPIWSGLQAYLIWYPLIMIAVALGLFSFIHVRSGNLVHAQTAAFFTIAMFEMYQAFASRSVVYPSLQVGMFKNKWLVIAVCSSLLITVSIMFIPTLQKIFGTSALSVAEILIIIGLSSTGFIFLETYKYVTSRRTT